MKKGDIINGYTILKDFELSGLSKWTFAEKDGKEYFFKEFLAPVFPRPDSGGSEKVKEKKRKACEEFKEQQMALIAAVSSKVSEGGNLIFTKDFFRHESKYYKVTDKVDISSVTIEEISELPFEQRILILKTASASLRVLHMLEIVHGDLKPDNILIRRTDKGAYVAKLIDFDSSYFSGNPPKDPEKVVGDQTYYSPELEKYITGDTSVKYSDLQLKSDIFALGVIFSQYLTGQLPLNIPEGSTASNAINNGKVLKLAKRKEFPSKLDKLINAMLSENIENRPRIMAVFTDLKEIDKPEIKEEPDTPEKPIYPPKPKIKFNMKKIKDTEKDEPPKPEEKAPIKSKLKINMKNKK